VISEQVAPDQAAGQGRHLHWLTPLRRAWLPIGAVGVGLGRDPEQLRDTVFESRPWVVAVVVLALLAVGSVAGYVSWRFTYYALTPTELRIRTGVLFRRTTHIRLDRIQAVDVVQSLFARVVGVASLKIDVVGTSDSDVLAYVSEDEARALRGELLLRARGTAGDPQDPVATPPAQHLLHVPPRALALSLLLRGPVLVLLLACSAALLGWVVAGADLTILPAALIPAATVLYITGQASVGRFLEEYDWTLAATADGLTIDRGLLQRAHETVPVGRVQTVSVIEPLLWRSMGLARVEMHVAGSTNTVLVPVAPREAALGVLTHVVLGQELPPDQAFHPAPRAAARCLPIWWRGQAFAVTAMLFVTRRGLLQRRTTLVPHVKAQSIRLTRGPWQRLWGLCSVHVDAAAGASVTASQRPVDEGAALLWAQGERSRLGRRAARGH
jgi:putative membrane protein